MTAVGRGSLSVCPLVSAYSLSNSSAMALYLFQRKSFWACNFFFFSFVLCLSLFALRASRCVYVSCFFICEKLAQTCPKESLLF